MIFWELRNPSKIATIRDSLMTHQISQDCRSPLSSSCSAFGGLLWSSLQQDTEYYKHVDEVMASPEQWQGKRCSSTASSCKGTMEAEAQHARVSVQGREQGQASCDASYTGVVPDTFKDEAEVVLKGRLTRDGFPRRPERRHGEVPVEVRSEAKAERQPEASGYRVTRSPMASLGTSPARDVRRLQLRGGVSVVGARRGSRRLIESGIGAFYLVAALMTVASAVMINAFVTDDFSIKYVARYSDSVQPLFYKITSYWGGLDGSIMFWVFLLSMLRQRSRST